MVILLSLLAAAMMFIFLIGALRLLEVYRDLPKVDLYDRSLELNKSPLLSIIIPARNEEKNIGYCLQSILHQSYRPLEVIVVNDQSADRTAEIVESFIAQDNRIRMLPGASLPPGYSGMVYACAQGSRAALGDYLLFLDADTALIPRALEKALGYALEHQTDLLAVIPKAQIENFWEALIQPLMGQLFLLQFKAKALNDPEDPTATAWGGFLLFRREAYARIGGHSAMKGAVNGGPQSALLIKEKRMRLAYVLGANIVIARMNRGFRTVWNGWTRCIFLGLGRSVRRGLMAMLGLLVFMVLPWAFCLGGLLNWVTQGWSLSSLVFMLLWGAVIMTSFLHEWIIRRLFDARAPHVWLQPVRALLVIGIIANALWRVLWRGEITWSGRAYPTTG